MRIEDLINILISQKFIFSLIIILVFLILYKLICKIINLIIKKIDISNDKNSKKKKTYLKVINSSIRYIFIVLAILIILQVNGINVSSIIAGLGILSVIIGLALQDALKDIIMGFNIIVDNYFSVGDVIKIDDVEGKVIELGIKNTKLKDINNQNILVIANRNIGKSLILSDQLDIDIPLPYEENIEKIETLIDIIVKEVLENEEIKKVQYIGINEFSSSAICYRLRLWCLPEQKPQIKRNVLRTIKLKLDENNIQIPYTQIDIHSK